MPSTIMSCSTCAKDYETEWTDHWWLTHNKFRTFLTAHIFFVMCVFTAVKQFPLWEFPFGTSLFFYILWVAFAIDTPTEDERKAQYVAEHL